MRRDVGRQIVTRANGRRERERDKEKKLHRLNIAPCQRGLLANCAIRRGLLVTSVIQRASAKQTGAKRGGIEIEDSRGKRWERRGEGENLPLVPRCIYLGRDMKNASNGPRGTSPFKSTAILLLPTCHHFSDQKLPARVTFPVRRLTGTPPPLSALPPPPFPPFRPSGKASAYLSLNKARETLLYTRRIPGLCIYPMRRQVRTYMGVKRTLSTCRDASTDGYVGSLSRF